MESGALALLGKTVTLMESLGFLWLVHTGFELNLWNILGNDKSKEEVLSEKPEWNPFLLEHWLEQARIQGLLLCNDKRYRLSRLGKAIANYRDYGLEAMYKEFALYWGPVFAQLPKLITQEVSQPKMEGEMENELISRASRSSEFFVWPLLKGKCEKEHWQSLLDVGCGEGLYLRKFVEEFPNIQGMGIEINPTVVDRAQKQAKLYSEQLRIECGDILDYPSPSEQFDCCLLNNNIYYFSADDRVKLLTRIKKWLVPKGQIGILTALRGQNSSLPFFQTHIPQNLMSFFLACHEGFEGLPTQEEVIQLLNDTGFKDVEVIPLPFNVSTYFFARNS
jgi:SAM-dependent methyltransferase